MFALSRSPWPVLPGSFFVWATAGVLGLEASAPIWAGELPYSLLLRLLQIFWMLGCIERFGLRQVVGISWPAAADIRFFVFAAAICSFVSIVILLLSFGLLEKVAAPPMVASLSGLLFFLLIGPIAEELLFRGILYGFLRQTFGVPLSVMVSAVVFAIMHGTLAAPQLAGGIVFAVAYEFSRKLWIPVGLHIGANSAVIVITLCQDYWP